MSSLLLTPMQAHNAVFGIATSLTLNQRPLDIAARGLTTEVRDWHAATVGTVHEELPVAHSLTQYCDATITTASQLVRDHGLSAALLNASGRFIIPEPLGLSHQIISAKLQGFDASETDDSEASARKIFELAQLLYISAYSELFTIAQLESFESFLGMEPREHLALLTGKTQAR